VQNSLRLYLKVIKRGFFRFDTLRWLLRGFKSPSPQWVKIRLLLSQMIPGVTWLETGTYLGDTTRNLAKKSELVLTIEPSKELHDFASWRLRRKKNVRLLLGTSEEHFYQSLLDVEKRSLNIWLDGHYSGDVTFKGASNTPIVSELWAISKALDRFDAVKVFIDDTRCFYHDVGEENDYPGLQYLVDWARESGFCWHIEQDIFIAEYISAQK
jgi:hypothetical protein